MKALAVDDDSTTRMVLQEILRGYAEVHACTDGDEAVMAYRRELEHGEPYDLVCMDILMPRMGGIEELGIIRLDENPDPATRPHHTKVIMTTGADDRDTINQAFQKSCDAYVVKPIDTEDFNSVVGCLFPIDHRR